MVQSGRQGHSGTGSCSNETHVFHGNETVEWTCGRLTDWSGVCAPETVDAGLLGTSKRRWDERGFRIPESGGSVDLATSRVSFQPGSRRILESPAEVQEVWTVDSESIGQAF